ncbi:hypothetical protein Trydic_g18705 [Trypoxylus dichotomus]
MVIRLYSCQIECEAVADIFCIVNPVVQLRLKIRHIQVSSNNSVCLLLQIMASSAHLTLLIFTGLALNIASAQIPFKYRLPDLVRPTYYRLDIDTDLTNFNFSGHVYIDVVTTQPTNNITLHSKELTITDVQVRLQNGSSVFFAHDYEGDTDFLRINLTQIVAINTNLTLFMTFSGNLSNGNVGYYRASYVNEANEVSHMAITHLEATNARRAFPCFDQPNYKARFQITLRRATRYITASNARLVQTLIANDVATDIYDVTPVMSTYLIAFMVSDYAALSVWKNSATYTTYGRFELLARGDGSYSLFVGPRAIGIMNDFTNISYAIDKMDQVPVPNEFYKIGAMENWGMVTYREKYLMYNSESTTASEKQFIATIISHEFAHQWFGNLVTPNWWRYIWLNEGFATYFEMFITNQIEPTWNLMDQFITSIVQPALDDDAVDSSRPMSRDAESPAEIDAQYDTIVYEKAGSVIRMLASILGDVPFRNGLTTYLNTWKFSNAVPLNLYSSWQSVSPVTLNVTSIMHPWETQAGYPVVTITRTGNVFNLNQERFFINRAGSNNPNLWPIPLTWFTINSASNTITWFNTRNGSVNLNVNAGQWIIFNNNQNGFYRVNYDANNWQLIRNYLWTSNFTAIPPINRAQLLDDAFNLARSGRLNQSIALDIGSYVRNETEYVPLATFTKAFGHIDRLFTGREHHPLIRNYGLQSLQTYFDRFGFIAQNDTHLTKLTKVQVLTWLCRLEHTECRNTSTRIFNDWIISSTPIQPDSQNFVFCNGLRNTTAENWNTTLQRYSTLREDTQRTRIAQGLGCAANVTTLQRLLNLLTAIDGQFSQSDKLPVVTSVYTNNGVTGVNVVLQWLAQNFTAIEQRVGNVASIVRGVTNRVTTNEQIALFNQFVNQNRNSFSASLNQTVASAFTNIDNNIAWVNSTTAEVEEHFGGDAAAMCEDHFKRLYDMETDSNVNQTTEATIRNLPFAFEEVAKAIKKLKNCIGPSYDNMSNDLLNLLKARLEDLEIRDEQQGFIRNTSSAHVTFIIQQVKEKTIELDKAIYACFIDLTKAFDKVQLKDAVRILKEHH